MHRFVTRSFCALFFALTAASSAAAQWSSAQGSSAQWSSPWLAQPARLGIAADAERSQCPQGMYAVGLMIRSATRVNAIGVECAALGSEGEHRNRSHTSLLGDHARGRALTVRCASGHVITAMRARASGFIDQVSFACRSWSARQGIHGSLRWQAAHGGMGGEPVGPIECPNGMAVTTLGARTSGAHIGGLNVSCDALPELSLR